MKKALLLITIVNLNVSYLEAQINPTERYITQSLHIPTNIERYKIDYQLLDESLISDSKEILLSINIDQFEAQRREDEDVHVLDETTGIMIVLYSYSKCTVNKNQTLNAPNSTK